MNLINITFLYLYPVTHCVFVFGYDYEISIVSSARALGSVILAGKPGSRRHSTTSFSESVVVAGTS